MVENFTTGPPADSSLVRDGRIPSLDGIRALAIGMVVLSHLSGAPGFFTLPGGTADWLGETGVRIFFVLSGFLITTLLLAEYTKNGEVNLLLFYIRRCFRIFPAFYLYLLVLAALSAFSWILLLPGDLAKAALYVVDYCPWDSTSNFVRHIWSLSVEEQFYLVWPVAIWALGIRRAKWIAVISIIASPFWRIAVISFFPVATETLFRRFDCLTDALATGCLLACIGGSLSGSAQYRAILRSRWMHLLPVIVLAAAATDGHPHLYLFVSDSVMHLGIALYMHRAILYPPRFLNLLVLRQIGLMSYSVYLWQQLFCSGQEGLARWPWFLALPLTAAASAISYYGVELPLQQWGRRLTKPQLSKSLAPV